jgi:predicted histidine transporter YuiF (NhaC family)
MLIVPDSPPSNPGRASDASSITVTGLSTRIGSSGSPAGWPDALGTTINNNAASNHQQ